MFKRCDNRDVCIWHYGGPWKQYHTSTTLSPDATKRLLRLLDEASLNLDAAAYVRADMRSVYNSLHHLFETQGGKAGFHVRLV